MAFYKAFCSTPNEKEEYELPDDATVVGYLADPHSGIMTVIFLMPLEQSGKGGPNEKPKEVKKDDESGNNKKEAV